MSRLRHRINESVSMDERHLKCTAQLLRRVNMMPLHLRSDCRSQIVNGPNISRPQYVSGGDGLSGSFGRSAICSTEILPRKILHVTHNDITSLTDKFPLITQKPFDLTSFKAELHPA